MNGAWLNDGAVKGSNAVEFANNAEKDRAVLYLSIRIVGGHDATLAQLDSANADITNGNDSANPVALIQIVHAGDENIGAKAALVNVHGLCGTIGGDEQWQNVKALRLRNLFQASRFAHGRTNQCQRFDLSSRDGH